MLLAACAPAVLALGTAAADGDGPTRAYVALASASSARVTWIVPGEFAVEEVADGGGPVAQSRLDSGSGESFASLPYPGGTAIAYQGLLNVATGVSSPVEYPFFVHAASPGEPEAELAEPSGAYRLRAEAAGASTGAVARFRPGLPEAAISGAEATTSIFAEGATVASVAESVSEGISLADGLLRIGSVRSRSATSYTDGAGAPETETSLVVEGLVAGDIRFGVGPDGVVVLGQPVPFTPADAQSLLDEILAPAGLSLRLVAAEPLTGGARASALEIVSHQPRDEFPPSTLTLRLGGASSAVSLGEAPLPLPPAGEVPDPTVPAPIASEPAGATPPAAAADPPPPATAIAARESPPAPPFAPSPVGSPFPALRPLPGTGTEPAPAAPTPPYGGTEVAARPIVQPRQVGSTRLVYGVMGGGAALMLLLGGALTRRGGVAAWLDA